MAADVTDGLGSDLLRSSQPKHGDKRLSACPRLRPLSIKLLSWLCDLEEDDTDVWRFPLLAAKRRSPRLTFARGKFFFFFLILVVWKTGSSGAAGSCRPGYRVQRRRCSRRGLTGGNGPGGSSAPEHGVRLAPCHKTSPSEYVLETTLSYHHTQIELIICRSDGCGAFAEAGKQQHECWLSSKNKDSGSGVERI